MGRTQIEYRGSIRKMTYQKVKTTALLRDNVHEQNKSLHKFHADDVYAGEYNGLYLVFTSKIMKTEFKYHLKLSKL